MRFLTYWAKAKATVQRASGAFDIECFGASDVSVDDARRIALKKAQAVAQAIARDARDYDYGDHPMREEVVRTIDHQGRRIAVLTRNAYGAVVLNTEQVLFADIDDAPPSLPAGCLGGLFGARRADPEAAVLAQVRGVVERHPGLGLRLYRTAMGHRALVTSQTFDPRSVESGKLLRALRSDRLYIALCQRQECFRARVSAKPWRCGVSRPPYRFPWLEPGQEQSFRAWQENYHRHADHYATCRWIADLGNPQVAAEIAPIVSLHDHLACVDGAPLA